LWGSKIRGDLSEGHRLKKKKKTARGMGGPPLKGKGKNFSGQKDRTWLRGQERSGRSHGKNGPMGKINLINGGLKVGRNEKFLGGEKKPKA